MVTVEELPVKTPQFMDTPGQWKWTFKERFCEVYKCAPADFEKSVFWRCLHWHAWPLAIILFRRDPKFFREDIEFIHELAMVNSPYMFKSELNRYHGRNVREKGFLRGTFHIRVSARRVITLKNKLFRAP